MVNPKRRLIFLIMVGLAGTRIVPVPVDGLIWQVSYLLARLSWLPGVVK